MIPSIMLGLKTLCCSNIPLCCCRRWQRRHSYPAVGPMFPNEPCFLPDEYSRSHKSFLQYPTHPGFQTRNGKRPPIPPTTDINRPIRPANAFRPSASASCHNDYLPPTGLPANTYPSWRPPNGTRTKTERLRSPQQIFVGAPGEEPDGNKKSGSYCRKP